jgi:Xaa-Pro aminopeptidase
VNLNRVRLKLKENVPDVIYTTAPSDIFYLSGFRGVSDNEREATVLVRGDSATLITSIMYGAEARKLESEDLKVELIASRKEFEKVLRDFVKQEDKVGFSADHLTVREYNLLTKKYGFNLLASELVAKARQIKSDGEIALITKAVELTKEVIAKNYKRLEGGETELEVKQRIIADIQALEYCELAFEPIVAFAENSANPHHRPGGKKLQSGILLIDAGVKYKGYCGDITRTYWWGGDPDPKFTRAYKTVSETKRAVERLVNSGTEINKVIDQAKLLMGDDYKYMLHSLGHGLGIDIHENPPISPASADALKEGMVFTIEPGLYYKDWGGIRLEDCYYVQKDQLKKL